MQPADRELVDRFLQRGDEEAFRLLFRRHSPRLYALSLRLLAGRSAEAEDAVQDTWIRAADRLRAFEWRSALSTWLCAIVINCARERLRALGPGAEDADAIEIGTPPAPVGPAIDLERALALLPDGYRIALVLHDVEGYTHEEIAAQLEIAVGTSKSQLSRARRAMRALLAGHGQGAAHER